MLEPGGLVRLIYDPLSLLLVHFSNRSYTVSPFGFSVPSQCALFVHFLSLQSVVYLPVTLLDHTRWNTHSLEHPR